MKLQCTHQASHIHLSDTELHVCIFTLTTVCVISPHTQQTHHGWSMWKHTAVTLNLFQNMSICAWMCWNARHVIEQCLGASAFPLRLCSLLCDCAGRAPSRLFCVCEIFMHRSGDVLWGCSSGERQPAFSSSFPLILFRSALSLWHVLCSARSPPFSSAASAPFPLLRCRRFSEGEQRRVLRLLLQRPSIFQDCLKIDVTSSSRCTLQTLQPRHS